jgi:multiple sugar transport system substrate-binding protein
MSCATGAVDHPRQRHPRTEEVVMRQPHGARQGRRFAVAVMAAAIAGAVAIAPAAAQTAEIEYAIWGDPAELTSQIALVDAFMAAHPDIKVEVTVSDWDAYWDKLQAGLAGGAAPDVFAMDGPLFPDYQSRGVLLDLTPFI